MKKFQKILTLIMVCFLMLMVLGVNSSVFAKSLSEIFVGYSQYTLGAPYFKAQVETAKAVAKELGIKLVAIDAGNDMVKQIADVEDLLVQGIDVLILNPQDPKGLVTATKKATEAGVPVIIIDSSIDPSADFITTVQSNNDANGELVGEWLVKEMDKLMPGKELKIALISGAKGNPVGKARRNGVFKGIIEQQLRSHGKSGFEIVAQGWGTWAHEGGLNAMEDILVANPDINVLLTENDSMALGAIKAIENIGKVPMKDIIVCAAADGQKEAIKLIKEGKYGATGMNSPVLTATTTVEIAVEVILEGKKEYPSITYTPPAVITKENADKYYDPNAIF